MRLLFAFLLVNMALAEVDELYIIAGYANQTRYAYNSKEIYNAFIKENPDLQSIILADTVPDFEYVENEDGSWSLEPVKDWDHKKGDYRIWTQSEIDNLWMFGPTFTRLKKMKQIQEAFKSSKAKSEERHPLIFITNHGGAPTNYFDVERERDPRSGIAPQGKFFKSTRLNSTISLTDPEESFGMDSFSLVIRSEFDENDIIRMVGVQCFGGGLHEIAFSQRNVCAATATDWITVSTSFESTNQYVQGITNEKSASPSSKLFDLNRDGQTSLQEAHLAGIANDTINWGRGQLSSMAYVDMILKEGAYSANISQEYYNPADDPTLKDLSESDCITCTPQDLFYYHIFPDYEFAKSIEEIQAKLQDGLFVPEIHSLTLDELVALPTQLRSIYENLLENNKFKIAQFKVLLSIDKKQKKHDELEQKILVLQSKTLTDNEKKELDKMQQNLIQYNTIIERLLTPLRGLTNYFLHLKKVARFFKSASRSQKRKYLELLNCEMAPL